MGKISLDSRLFAAANYATPGGVLADIGTDHGYLPAYLLQNGICDYCYASDINEQPLMSAAKTVRDGGVNDRCECILCDGLSGFDDDARSRITDIVIAGMGGELIASIIDRAAWVRDEKYNLILQPMSKAEHLRRYLCESGFDIMDETACVAANKHYTVINARYSGAVREYDTAYLYAGALLDKTDAAAVEYKRMTADKLTKIAVGRQSAKRDDEVAREYLAAAKIIGE